MAELLPLFFPDQWKQQQRDGDHNNSICRGDFNFWPAGRAYAGRGPFTPFDSGCHGNFHKQIPETGPEYWMRHPSDAVIPNSGEYRDAFGAGGSGTGIYDPLVPIARPSLSAVSNTVAINTDMVMCLSCHRPHGSPYYKLMRWDYKNWPGSWINGCATCHTSKD